MDAIGEYEIHPAANLFPMMDDASYEELKASIKASGQEDDAIFYNGQILDGRNRIRACVELGIAPTWCEIDDPDDPDESSGYFNGAWTCDADRIRWENRKRFDPVDFVLRKNLHRRHLTASQRAMVAVRVKELEGERAKERQAATLKQNASTVPEKLPEREKGDSRDKAGKALNVSGKLVDHAATVKQHGSPELIAAVERGEVKVSKAAKVAKVSPPEIQLEEATAKPPKKPRAKKAKAVLATKPPKKEEAPTQNKKPEATDRQHEIAQSAVADFTNMVSRSKLVKLSVKNPSRDYAFDEAIQWLEYQKKNPTWQNRQSSE